MLLGSGLSTTVGRPSWSLAPDQQSTAESKKGPRSPSHLAVEMMRLSLSAAVAVVLGVQTPRAALLRSSVAAASASGSAGADWAPGGDAEKVEHLLMDIDESVKKAGSDAEFVYTSLYNYDAQIESGLDKEIARVNKELAMLHAMMSPKQAAAKSALAGSSEAAVHGQELTVGQQAEVARAMETIRILTEFMTRGNMARVELSPAERELGPTVVLSGSLKALRRLLAAHQEEMRPHFVDVYEAFVPAGLLSLVQTQANSRLKLKKAASLKVHLTPALRARTEAALTAIREQLTKSLQQQQQVLLQTRTASTLQAANEGMLAESEQETEELKFSASFAQAVVKIDGEFRAKVHESIGKKAAVVEAIRHSRDNQHRTLSELVDLLRGRYLADTPTDGQEGTTDDAQNGLPSFVQVAAQNENVDKVQPPAEASASSFQASSLQLQVETAIKNKADTHSILMKVQDMLDRNSPIEAEGVNSVIHDLGSVLQEVQGEQTRAEETKRRCQEQALHGAREEHEMVANLALMTTVRSRTKAAIRKAKRSLKSIVSRMASLEVGAKDLSNVVAKSTHTLEDQSKDRKTIIKAVEKAREIVAEKTSAGPAADSLLVRMLQELGNQETHEREYRATEVAFKGAFAAYSGNYLELLQERRGHYESALSSLELYAGEVESDAAAEADTIESSKELATEGTGICQGMLQAYASESKRRQDLSKMLQSVVPELPKVLS